MVLTRLLDGYDFSPSPSLWNIIILDDFGEKFRQPGACCGAEVNQKLRVDVVIPGAVPVFTLRSALSISAVEKSGGRLLSGACRQKLRH